MTAARPVRTRRLNAGEAFVALRDLAARHGIDADALQPHTPLDDYLSGDVDAETVTYHFTTFGPPLPDDWWERFDDDSLLADLAAELADAVEVPAVEPANEDGAVLLARKLLVDNGADPAQADAVTSDTRLAPFLRAHPAVFAAHLPLAAPGRLPPLRLVPRGEAAARLKRAAVGVLAAAAAYAVCRSVFPRAAVFVLLLFAEPLIGLVVSAGVMAVRGLRSDALGDLRTFGDLAAAMTDRGGDDDAYDAAGPAAARLTP